LDKSERSRFIGRQLQLQVRAQNPGAEEMSGKLVAVLARGILSPVLDSTDVRKPLTLSDSQFDRMVRCLPNRDRCH
jgi:hypothetical protein